MSFRDPTDPGWIDLRKGKKLWARYHAGRRMLHMGSIGERENIVR